MTPDLFAADGKPIRISKRIGKGGEGEVYEVEGSRNLALKFYTVSDVHAREDKIRRMVAEQLAHKSPIIAFPVSLVFDRNHKFAGFTMLRITGHQPLHELYSPGARKAHFPQANYKFLVLSAANIARAIGMAHATGCVVGDINHSGILISPEAKVVLIDADSFQVSDGTKFYLCKVGVPEYTPPELQGQALGGIVRSPDHDAFGLAVVIFQLLFMGRHPFSGKFSAGDMPLEKAIGEHRFAYSLRRKVGMELPPGVPTLRDFPAAVVEAFELAFDPEGRGRRPTAKQWMTLLADLASGLRACARTSLHHYYASAQECPWCRMEKRFAVPLFIPVLSAVDSTSAHTAIIGDVASIWRAIEAVPPPADVPFPEYKGANISPSASTLSALRNRATKRLVGWTMVGGAVVLTLYDPAFVLLSVLVGGAGWCVAKIDVSGGPEVIQNYRAVQTRLYQAEAEWQTKNSASEYQRLKSWLLQKKHTYDGLQAEQSRRLDEYAKDRRAVHLKAFLDGFLIRRFKIPKVGPGRQAVLLSYGIETAGDVNEAAVQRVPGFGPKTSQPLLNWRRHMESRFNYTAAPTPADHAAMSAIRADIARRAAELRAELSKGPAQLQHLSVAFKARQAAAEPFLQTILAQRAQAVADLEALGLPLPDVPRPTPVPARHPQVAPPPLHAGTGASSTIQAGRCPKCGGVMVIRLARRGRNAGNKFYGCTRYPGCNGTRPYP